MADRVGGRLWPLCQLLRRDQHFQRAGLGVGAGDYIVVTGFKGDKSESETPFSVKAGERTEVSVP